MRHTVPLERILTHSRAKTFRACPRKHALAYTLGYRARGTSNALAFGSAVHKALEWYWLLRLAAQIGDSSFTADPFEALEVLHDPFLRAKARVLCAAYFALWDVEAVTVLAVEAPFAFPLVNERGRASNYWFVGGKIDLVVQLADGRIAIVEHKCIAGSARIFDHSTGTYERADDLFCRGTAPVVTALDASGKFVTTQALPLRAASVRSIYQVRTLGGRTLRVSGNHPVLTPGGWVAAEALVPGEWVATPRHMPCARPDAPLSDEAVRLIGYMIGDGSFSRMMFTKTDPVVLADVVRCAAQEGEETHPRYPSNGRAPYVPFSHVGAVAAVMTAAGFTKKTLSADKRLPFHLGLSDRQIGQLLGALWSTDGCIDTFRGTKLRIIYTSRSRGLCEDIQHALQRLGIISSVRTTSVAYAGERRAVSTVNVVTREGRRRFLALALDGFIPVLRSRVAIADAFAFIPESRQGSDARSQPSIDPHVWWDRVETIEQQQEEQTYDVEVPGAHTFVVDGVVTHNTSSEDTSAGGAYRDRLAMDSQVSIYFEGASSLGYEADVCIYDVLLKPTQSPLEATPIEQRKYTKATKTKPSQLYANQREFSETPEEYEARIAAVVQSDLSRFLPRWEVPRLENERADSMRDLWATAQEILALENAVHPWPRRNPDACHTHGACEFLPVCRREASLDDGAIYVRVGPHPELQTEAEPAGSQSEREG